MPHFTLEAYRETYQHAIPPILIKDLLVDLSIQPLKLSKNVDGQRLDVTRKESRRDRLESVGNVERQGTILVRV
jgi:hypothetical protein